MSATTRFTQFLSLIVLATVQFGCGPRDGKTEIEGTANWNGTPIDKGYIELHPTDGSGQVDGAEIVDGSFTIRTTEGEKLVRVTAERKIGDTPASARMPSEPIYHQYIPKNFNEASDVKVTVSDGDPLQIDLNGKELKPGAVSAEQRARRAAQGGG